MVKESIFEINHAKHLSEYEFGTRSDVLLNDDCHALESLILDEEKLSRVNPFLFPLAIEFALTGAIFFYRMLKKVGER